MGFINGLQMFFQFAILAAFAENALLNRIFDASFSLKMSIRHPKYIFLFGIMLSTMSAIAAVPTYLVNSIMAEFQYRYIFVPIVYIILISATFFAVIVLIQNYVPSLKKVVVKMLPFATFNCALLGGLLIAGENFYTLSQTIGFAFGTGIGYTIASLMVKEGLRRLALCDVPKAFKGLPVSLIYIGVLSLAVYGLTGRWMVY